MCDAILATPSSTAGRFMLFGKNSDRQRNEAQAVELFTSASHAPGAQLDCTFISIPQVSQTHAVLISRPFWMWGAEMGANEHGVVIGNVGLNARVPPPDEAALLGMDLLRLALERARTASEAIRVMTTLLEQFGQGGDCGHLTPAYYHNGFMVADPREAFVVETVGREWMVEQVRGVHALSNAYSISRGAERVSDDLLRLLQDSGWSSESKPSFSEVLADPQHQHIGSAEARRACSNSLLSRREGHLSVADMMAILRDHGSGEDFHPGWSPECTVKRTLCMHAGAEDRPGHTCGSMVSQLQAHDAVHWLTGTAAPCISIFKPVLLDVPLPVHGPRPTDRFDPQTLWWRHERLHRAALLGEFGRFLDDIRPERDALEADFRARLQAVLNGGRPADRLQIITQCWNDAIEMEDSWYARIGRLAVPHDVAYVSAWTKFNALAGVKLPAHAAE